MIDIPISTEKLLSFIAEKRARAEELYHKDPVEYLQGIGYGLLLVDEYIRKYVTNTLNEQ